MRILVLYQVHDEMELEHWLSVHKTRHHPPFHAMIEKLRDNHNLKRLRVSMSYHRFPNLGQAFQSGLNVKLTKNIGLANFSELPFNCNRISRVDRTCMYEGECRISIVVYKEECKDCKMCYIGNAQQILELHIYQHLAEACNLVNKGKTSDLFSEHFTIHQHNRQNKIIIGEVHKSVIVSILWQGNPVFCNKYFEKLNCSLCIL